MVDRCGVSNAAMNKCQVVRHRVNGADKARMDSHMKHIDDEFRFLDIPCTSARSILVTDGVLGHLRDAYCLCMERTGRRPISFHICDGGIEVRTAGAVESITLSISVE